MYKIFVAAGASMPNKQSHIDDAISVGKLLAENNYYYCQGASNLGMMGLTLNEFQKYSDNVDIISPQYYKEEALRIKCKNCINVNSVNGRLETINRTCDAAIILPGGNGTLDEITNFVETKRANEHSMAIILVNTDGFYNEYIAQMNKMIDCGYVVENFFPKLVNVVNSAKEAIDLINKLLNN